MPHQDLPPGITTKPHWNELSRELLLGAVVLKKMRGRAENQEIILEAFQNAGWPDQLPLQPLLVLNRTLRHRSLVEAIAGINRGQPAPGIQFFLSDDDSRISWQLQERTATDFIRIDHPDETVLEPDIPNTSPTGTYCEDREPV